MDGDDDEEYDSLVNEVDGGSSRGDSSPNDRNETKSGSSSAAAAAAAAEQQQRQCRRFVSMLALLILAGLLVVGKVAINSSYNTTPLEEAEDIPLSPNEGSNPAASTPSSSSAGDEPLPDGHSPPETGPEATPAVAPPPGGASTETTMEDDEEIPDNITGGGEEESPAAAAQTATDDSQQDQTPAAAGSEATQQDSETPPAEVTGQTNGDGDGDGDGVLEEKPGFKRLARQYSEVYVRRGKPASDAQLTELAKQWGEWTLVDDKAAQRPNPEDDYFSQYPHRDIPREQIPSSAWQKDGEYLPKFLTEGIDLVDRAMETILGEYGHSKFDEPDLTFEERSAMFNVTLVDLADPSYKSPSSKHIVNAGWMAERSYRSLVRRLLHAVMTEDAFTFVMGGHSAAAGHGNNFQQTYTVQVQKALEPVFARLGVLFEAHNIGMGGMGTLHNAMASGDIYGKEVDILMWDSHMTEKDDHHWDVFARQGLMSGNRVPMLWGGTGGIKRMHIDGDAEVAQLGDSKCCTSGIPKTMSEEQALTLPWAARYLDCDRSVNALCTSTHKFNATCWIDRPDVTPREEQMEKPAGQASWHPGNRSHQLQSRALSFPILMALRDALKLWRYADGYAVADTDWHMSSEYENTRSKVSAMDDENIPCLVNNFPNSFCRYPVNGRSEFLPRSNPVQSSLRSIMKHGEYFPGPEPNWYDPPDVFNPRLEPPDGALDYLHVVENGIDFVPSRGRRKMVALRKSQISGTRGFPADDPIMKPGTGWGLHTKAAADHCDGTYDSFCARDADSTCLLYAHSDDRGGIFFDGLSGWVVFKVEQVRYGTIVPKIEWWHGAHENPATEGWTCENNDCQGRDLEETIAAGSRQTKAKVAVPCDDFKFEYAIDGKVTSWSYDEFMEKRQRPKGNVDLWVLLDDPDYVKDGPKDVEVALRMTGCARDITFLLTHMYWH